MHPEGKLLWITAREGSPRAGPALLTRGWRQSLPAPALPQPFSAGHFCNLPTVSLSSATGKTHPNSSFFPLWNGSSSRSNQRSGNRGLSQTMQPTTHGTSWGFFVGLGFFFVPFFSPRLFSLVKPEGNAALRKPLECQISWEGNAINSAGERHAGNLGKAAPPWCSPAVESQERLGDYGLKRAHLQPDC